MRGYLSISTVASRPWLKETFYTLLMCRSFQWASFSLTLISLSNLGSEVLGLYIYGCLYLRDGDQGKSLSTQMFTSPIRFTLIYFWEPAERGWSAEELAGGVGDEKL